MVTQLRDEEYTLSHVLMIAMKRAEATVFETSFRILPVTGDSGYEYGKIIDQI